jgi:predicted nucleotidyltransferase
VDATAIVARVARVLERHGLEAVMIGNAAAAMHGAPVTTVDLDFLFCRTRTNLKKLSAIAAELGATLYAPLYPASQMLRMMNDEEGLQLDFLGEAAGVRSFEGLRKRAQRMPVAGATVAVADLADIIKMKRATNRPRDRAVLEILEKTVEAIQANPQSQAGSAEETE